MLQTTATMVQCRGLGGRLALGNLGAVVSLALAGLECCLGYCTQLGDMY